MTNSVCSSTNVRATRLQIDDAIRFSSDRHGRHDDDPTDRRPTGIQAPPLVGGSKSISHAADATRRRQAPVEQANTIASTAHDTGCHSGVSATPVAVLEVDLADAEAGSLPAQLASQLDPELRQLAELVDGRHNERKKSTNVRLQRQQVIREFDFHIRGIVRRAQGMFRLAGRDDLGKRMRPLLKRVLRKLSNPQPQQDADPKDEGETQTETTTETTGTEATATEPSQAGRPTSQPAITA